MDTVRRARYELCSKHGQKHACMLPTKKGWQNRRVWNSQVMTLRCYAVDSAFKEMSRVYTFDLNATERFILVID